MIEDYEFTIIYDFHIQIKEDTDEQWKVKRNCKRKWYVSDLSSITDIREIPNSHGKPYKNKCEVFSRLENKWTPVEGGYNKILNIIKPEKNKQIGYAIQRRK